MYKKCTKLQFMHIFNGDMQKVRHQKNKNHDWWCYLSRMLLNGSHALPDAEDYLYEAVIFLQGPYYAPTPIGRGIKRCFCLTSDVCRVHQA